MHDIADIEVKDPVSLSCSLSLRRFLIKELVSHTESIADIDFVLLALPG